jgi:hypothetical protein
MAAPGTIGNLVAPGEDAANRKHEDLSRQVKELGPSIIKTIRPLIDEIAAAAAAAQAAADAANAAVADLAAQQAYLQSLISRDETTAGFNSGVLINDSTFRLLGAETVVSGIAIPTGKVRVTMSVSEISLSPGSSSVIGGCCYAIDGVHSLDPNSRYARVYAAGVTIGTSAIRIGTEDLTPGTYTIRAQRFYWAAGVDPASIQYGSLRLLAEVIGSD